MTVRRSFTSLPGGKPKNADPRRRKKRARVLPPTVALFQQAQDTRFRALPPLPAACNICGELAAKIALGCGTFAAGTEVNGHVLERDWSFRIGVCRDCALDFMERGECTLTLQRAPDPEPWPCGIGHAYDTDEEGTG